MPASSFVGADLPDSLLVRVVDAKGRGVRGHSVTWGAGFGGTISMSESLTDENGRTRSAWRVGTEAGEYTATAQAVTVDGPLMVSFRAVVTPGPTAVIQISPSGAWLGLNETRRFSALQTDAYGNSITDRPITWSSSNSGIASVDQQTGLVRGMAPGVADIIATSDGKSASVKVTVAEMASGEDPFDSNTLGQYTQYADVPATWSISEGILTVQGDGQQSFQIRNDVVMRDGWVEVDMDRADEGGLVLRFQDEGNLYLLSIHDDGSLLGHRNLEIFRRTAGQWQLVSSSSDIQWPRGTVKTIRFEAGDNVLRAYVDGALFLEATDSSIISSGGVGVRYNDVPESPGTDMARYLTFRWSGR